METINYNGRTYNAETVSSYYDGKIIDEMNYWTDDAQEFFEAYIKAVPDFIELFKYDIDPID